MSKKIEVYYDELSHSQAMGAGWEKAQQFKKAKEELQRIIEKPIPNFTEFRADIIGYALTQIKLAFPKPFALGLKDDVVLNMLGIDLKILQQLDAELRNTSVVFVVDPVTGEASPSEDKTPFKWFAESQDQLDRLAFANELADVLKRAHKVQPHKHKSEVTLGLNHIVYFDGPNDQLIPNPYWVINGIK